MSAAVDADALLDVPVIIVIIDIVGIIGIVVVHERLEEDAHRGPFNADDCLTLSKRSD
jgi:hypothetical protein